MSGFYQNWYKVQHQDVPNDIIPMQSGGFQTPFFFGGSQVPSNLGLSDTNLNIKGSGYDKVDFLPSKLGKGVQGTGFVKSSNIHIPRSMKY